MISNSSSVPVRIDKVAASCGCTVAEVSRNLIDPGESLEVAVTLSFQKAGRRTEKVYLSLDDGNLITLYVSGVARTVHDFYVAQRAVQLSVDTPRRITLVVLDVADDKAPQDPHIEVPQGVNASFEGWQLAYPSDESIGRPSRWHGIVNVQQVDDRLTERPEMTVSLTPDREVQIDLSGRPW